MAGENVIRVEIVGGASGVSGGPGLSSEHLNQSMAFFSEITKKIDNLLSATQTRYAAKNPEEEQTRKLELLNAKEKAAINVIDKKNAAKEAEQINYRKTALEVVNNKAQSDINRLRENTISQREIQHQKRQTQERQAALREQKSQADHARRLELKRIPQEEKDKVIGGVVAGAVSATLASIGKTFGNSQATYAMGNSLVRPDIALANLNSARVNAGLDIANSGLMGLGAIAGSAIGGIPGGIIGGLAGGATSGLLNLVAPSIVAGYNMAAYTQPQMGYLPQYSYGGSYSGMDPRFIKDMMVQPGGKENLPQMYNSYYGSASNSAGFESAASSTLKYAYLTGNQGNVPALLNPLSNILKMSGMGGDAIGTAGMFKTLTQYQRQYGGDTVANLQLIATLLQSSGINNVPLASSIVYGSQAMNPAIAQSAAQYASSTRLSQFTQGIMMNGLLGVSPNDLNGLNGTNAQRKAIAKLQGMNIGNAGELTTGGVLQSIALGNSMYAYDNANLNNQNALQNSPDTLGGLINWAFHGNKANSYDGIYDPITVQQRDATASALATGQAVSDLPALESQGFQNGIGGLLHGLNRALGKNTDGHESTQAALNDLSSQIASMKQYSKLTSEDNS